METKEPLNINNMNNQKGKQGGAAQKKKGFNQKEQKKKNENIYYNFSCYFCYNILLFSLL